MPLDFRVLTPSLFKLESKASQLSFSPEDSNNFCYILQGFSRELSALSPAMFCETTSVHLRDKISSISSKLGPSSPLLENLNTSIYTSVLHILRKHSPEEKEDSHAKNLIQNQTQLE